MLDELTEGGAHYAVGSYLHEHILSDLPMITPSQFRTEIDTLSKDDVLQALTAITALDKGVTIVEMPEPQKPPGILSRLFGRRG